MCQNFQKIKNKYNGRTYYVPCGKCAECLQRSADSKARKIRATNFPNTYPLFVTLTYDSHYLPYIPFGSLPFNKPLENTDFNLYIKRLNDIEYIKNRKGVFPSTSLGQRIIGNKYIDDFSINDNIFYSKFPFPSINSKLDYSKRLVILFYKDVQNFIKRLRNKTFLRGYYVAGEYGEFFSRPHWHLLLFIDNSISFSELSTIIKFVWLYGRVDVQIARDISGYLSTYVSANMLDLHPFIKKYFPPLQRNSWSFRDHSYFDLQSIYNEFLEGKFELSINLVHSFSNTCENEFLLPSYILNYYFPNYRLYKYISPLDFYDLLINRRYYDTKSLYKLQKKLNTLFLSEYPIFAHPFVCSLDNTFERFFKFSKELGISVIDYCFFAFRYIVGLKSYLLKKQYEQYGKFSPFYYDFDLFLKLKNSDDVLDFVYYEDYVSIIKLKESVKNLGFFEFSPLFADSSKYINKYYNKSKKHVVLNNFYSQIFKLKNHYGKNNSFSS